jgi:hypothetical protein
MEADSGGSQSPLRAVELDGGGKPLYNYYINQLTYLIKYIQK